MNNWKIVKAKDFIKFNPNLKIHKGQVGKKVAMDKIIPWTKFISEYENAPYSGGAKFQNNDTLLARITPCLENGKTAFVDFLDEQEIGFGSTEFIVLRAKDNISDPNYVYYLATSDKFREIAIKSMVGSSGRQRVQLDVLKECEFPLPPLNQQKEIVSLLIAIDAKIQCNGEINDNLDALLVCLFRQMISNHPNSADWDKRSLTEIANYKNGLAMQRYRPQNGELDLPVLKIRELGQGACLEDSERCSAKIDPSLIVEDGDVIFSWSGTLLVKIWAGGKAGLNQHLFKVSSDEFPKWFYYMWTRHHLRKFVAVASAKATTMGHIKREDLDSSEVFIPPENEFERLNAIFKPLMEKIIQLNVENRKLVKLRDSLLPKLLSGEVELH